MSLIKKAVIKSYDPATHKASVQIAGSLAVWLDGVPVATDIPAADVVAGRQCTVLFLDPSNQDDAVVVTIQGAPPSGGGGGGATTFTGLTDTPAAYTGAALQYARVNAGETALEFHDLLNVANAWAALQTFNAGLKLAAGQSIQDSGGTGRIALATANPHATIGGGGGVQVNNYLGVQTTPATSPGNGLLRIDPIISGSFAGAYIGGTATGSGTNIAATGLLGTATSQGTGSAAGALGLSFISQLWAAGASASNRAMVIKHNYVFQANPVIEGIGVRIENPSSAATTATITDSIGIQIRDQSVTGAIITRQTGLHIEDQTQGTTRYLIFAGAALTGTPRLRLDAGTPGANQTMLHLAEGTTPTLRRVQWKDGGSIVAGDRVMVLV